MVGVQQERRMTRDEIIEAARAKAEKDERVLALLLGGSLGSDKGDAFSDADMILVVRPEAHAEFVAGARAWAETLVPLLIWKPPYPNLPLFTAVGEGWVRFDLTITVPGRIMGSQAGLKPLVDKVGVWAQIIPSLPPRPPLAADIEAIAIETIRILGLIPVVHGRSDWAVAVTGVALLRNQLVSLMVMDTAAPSPSGALNLKRILPAADIETLAGLPPLGPTEDSIMQANAVLAPLILNRARAMLAQAGGTWPQALEDALRAHLKARVGFEFPV
jgi:hypothetical protein